MKTVSPPLRSARQTGMALISSLLLLAVITILAVSMFRGFGVQERISSNVREKQRALQAAQTAQQYAEWWLSTGGGSANATTACDGTYNANTNGTLICSNTLASLVTNVTTLPWTGGVNGAQGTTYNPSSDPLYTMNVTTTLTTSSSVTGGWNSYSALPRFYIYKYPAAAADNQGSVYKIDAVGYGATSNAAVVIESTYEVGSGVYNLGGQ